MKDMKSVKVMKEERLFFMIVTSVMLFMFFT
jgi:hypothetical protein